MTDRPKVHVNILNTGTIQAGLETKVIGWMNEYRDKYDFKFFVPNARPIPNNRNTIVRDFLAKDFDILFMIDDDTVPTKNPFVMLEHDLDVVGGVYPGLGKTGFHFHAYDLDESQYPEKIFFHFVPPERREGVQKVDAVATGCIAVKRHVLEKMIKKGWAPFEDMFTKDGILITNDDMAFCLKCRTLKIPVHADWNILCDHLKITSLLEVIRLIMVAAQTGKAQISGDFEKHDL